MARRPIQLPTTKLYPPSTDAALLLRPELLSALAGLDDRKLAVVVAPTGAGKSTLLAQGFHRLAARGWDVAWLSLDTFDNEPRVFVRSLVAALLRARPELETALTDLVVASAEVPLTDAINGIIAVCSSVQGQGRPLAIFLDDEQAIDSADVLAALGYLIQYSDAATRFVIASQRRLPFGVNRLRARGAVIEIGFDELRLGSSEVRDYFRRTQQLTLGDEQVRELADRTEGWICGLQLASIALRQRGDDGSAAGVPFPMQFADGLLDEILARQPAETRAFLLDTAPLDAFCAPLGDAITGRDDAVEQIEALVQSQLFIIRLDPESIWFRYHHLFQDYLRRQKAAQGRPALQQLLLRASRWYVDNRMPAEAFRAALVADDAQAATGILERWGERLLRDGDFRALGESLQALGRASVRTSDRLNVLDAWTQLYLGDPISAAEALDAAEREAGPLAGPQAGAAAGTRRVTAPALRQRLQDEIRLVRAMCGVTGHDLVDSAVLGSDLATAFAPEDGLQRAWAQVVLGYGARAEGRQSLARRHFVEAIRIADGDNDLVVSLMARYNRAVVDQLIARPDIALQGLRQWLDDPGNRRWLRTGSSAFLLSACAIAHGDRLELVAAEKALDLSIELLTQTRTFAYLDIARVLRARVRALTGRLDQALADLDDVTATLREREPDRVHVRTAIARARTLIEAGGDDKTVAAALAQAEQVLVANDQWQHGIPSENAVQYELACCHRLARAGDDRALAERAGRGVLLERQAGRVRHQIEFLAWAALAAQRLGAGEQARQPLAEALRLAAPGAAWLPLVAAGPELLSIALDGEADAGLLEAVRRDAFQALRGVGAAVAEPAPLPHGLHRREQQILALVGQGLRNREIGERLHIGEETVKWYLKRAYEALGVRNRAHALARARELGLI